LEETDYPKEVAKEIKKVVALEGKEGPLSESLLQEGWILKSEEGVSYEEASEMLSRDKRILQNVAGDELPKDQPLTLCLYEREKPVKETAKPQKAKPDLSGVSLAERKREKREPVIWLIFCILLFAGSFAFVVYSFIIQNKDFTFYIALVNSALMFGGIIYSIIQIVRTRRDF
jgi:hypothetical protein